jgi:hypothetical protein
MERAEEQARHVESNPYPCLLDGVLESLSLLYLAGSGTVSCKCFSHPSPVASIAGSATRPSIDFGRWTPKSHCIAKFPLLVIHRKDTI